MTTALTCNHLTSKSNQFIFVPYCTPKLYIRFLETDAQFGMLDHRRSRGGGMQCKSAPRGGRQVIFLLTSTLTIKKRSLRFEVRKKCTPQQKSWLGPAYVLDMNREYTELHILTDSD